MLEISQDMLCQFSSAATFANGQEGLLSLYLRARLT